MLKKITSAILLTISLFILSGCGVTPIQNLSDQPIPAGLTSSQIETAIIQAGLTRNWRIKAKEKGHLVAEIMVRQHFVAVDINFSSASYKITYKDSRNMKYQDGKIHRKYNGWVANLNLDIQQALYKATL